MKKHIFIALFLIIVIGLVACTDTNTIDDDKTREEDQEDLVENDEDTQDEESIEIEKDDEIVEPDSQSHEKTVSLYFANLKYIETGDESLEPFIVQEKTLTYKDISLEEAIVKELMRAPKDPSMTTEIPSTAKLLGVDLDDRTVFVNFAQEGMFGGSTQESFTINQIVNSLLELDSVDKVQFLIDGEKAESLMGHFEIMDPFEE